MPGMPTSVSSTVKMQQPTSSSASMVASTYLESSELSRLSTNETVFDLNAAHQITPSPPISSPIHEVAHDGGVDAKSIESMTEIFPTVPISDLKDKLIACNGDRNEAIYQLLEPVENSSVDAVFGLTPKKGLLKSILYENGEYGPPMTPIRDAWKKQEECSGSMLLEDDDGDLGSEFDWVMANSYKKHNSVKKGEATIKTEEGSFQVNPPTDDPFTVAANFNLNSIKDPAMRKKVKKLSKYARVDEQWAYETLSKDDNFTKACYNMYNQGALGPMIANDFGVLNPGCSSFGASPARRLFKRDAPKLHTNRFVKKLKESAEAEASKLKPADIWTKEFLDPKPERVCVILGAGDERRSVTKQPLVEYSSVIKEVLGALSPSPNGGGQELNLVGMASRTFDILYQWLVCKNFNSVVDASEEDKIHDCIDLAIKVQTFKIVGSTKLTVEKLKEVLTKTRSALKGEHIELAFGLPAKHEIRTLLVKATVRSYVTAEYRKSINAEEDTNSVGSSSDSEAEQRQIAFGSFAFQKQYDAIPDFKMELLELANSVVTKGETFTTGKGRKQRSVTNFVDPLTDGQFSIKKA